MYLVTKHKRMLFALCLAALVAIMCSIFLTVPANASMNISESQDGNIRIITGEISPASQSKYWMMQEMVICLSDALQCFHLCA